MKITQFIHSIMSDVQVIYDDADFWCDIPNKVVNVGENRDTYGDRLIQQFVMDKFGISMHRFLIGCLHELGHIATYDEDLDQERSVLYLMLQLNFEEDKVDEYSYAYFSIPSEYEATKWAVNYYLSHKEYCDNFIKENNL